MNRRAGLPMLGALFLALLLALTSCSIVPTSSPTVPITQAPPRPAPEVGIEPLSPARGASPEEIVRGFIDASASSVRGHPVAVEHLTPEAAASWSDAAGITIIGPDYSTVASASGTVTVTADLVGTVDERGVFTVAPGPDPFIAQFRLVQVGGEWRIADPQDGLIMVQLDFERLYNQVNAYFLDPTGQQLVPDPRYLIGGEAQPTALVERLLEGASPALGRGVQNPLAGGQLARTVTVEGQTAMVDLTKLVIEPTRERCEVCAQLTWTLAQLEDAGIRSVTISVDGEPLDLQRVPAQQTTDDWQSFDPDASPLDAVGHYLENGALHTVVDGEKAPGPAGAGFFALSSAAVSTDVRTRALTNLFGVRVDATGATLLAGRYDGELTPVLTGRTLSAPTVARTRSEAWVVRDGTEVAVVAAPGPAGPTAAPGAVSVPTLSGLGRAQVIELSPDATRVALVVAGPEGGQRLYVGTVVQPGEAGAGVSVPDLREIAPGLTRVVDVGWRSSGQLWVLADVGGDRIGPYSVEVDGWGLDAEGTSGLPGEPTSLAVAPGRQPLVVADGRIWQWSGTTWVSPVRGREPVAGSAPFYPL